MVVFHGRAFFLTGNRLEEEAALFRCASEMGRHGGIPAHSDGRLGTFMDWKG